jgi:hypothetical protein
MKADRVTTHGFRSTFRDWTGDMTSFPKEIAEAALFARVRPVVAKLRSAPKGHATSLCRSIDEMESYGGGS